ncbi:MAG: hypothetical protein KF847_03985 [Pirellulales bacterium]|nr:hypothetical protein [Pirellulales bacterium]
MRNRTFNFALAACLSLLGTGCGPKGGLIPVTGTVKSADGAPLGGENALVVFQPVAGGKPAVGDVAVDGSFALTTTTPGDGANPGEYKVVLKIWRSYRDQTLAVPARYGEAATTPLTALVDAATTKFDFVVEQ